jgi:hypothetical protein
VGGGSGAGAGSGSGVGAGVGSGAGSVTGAGSGTGGGSGAAGGATTTTTGGGGVIVCTGIAAGRDTRGTGVPAACTAGCESNASRAASRGMGSVVRAPIGRLAVETGGGTERTGAPHEASAAAARAEATARAMADVGAFTARLRSRSR